MLISFNKDDIANSSFDEESDEDSDEYNNSEMQSNEIYSPIINGCGQIDYNNVDVSPLVEGSTQLLSYINHNNPISNSEQKIIIQTDKFQITQGGIPVYHEK